MFFPSSCHISVHLLKQHITEITNTAIIKIVIIIFLFSDKNVKILFKPAIYSAPIMNKFYYCRTDVQSISVLQ